MSDLIIPPFPKLYKNNNKNSISTWEIQILPSSSSLSSYDLVWYYGVLGGKMVENKKAVHSGKAGRSVLQQSILEAQSKWNDKKNKETYTELLPMDVSNSTGVIIRPMLAHTYLSLIHISEPTRPY